MSAAIKAVVKALVANEINPEAAIAILVAMGTDALDTEVSEAPSIPPMLEAVYTIIRPRVQEDGDISVAEKAIRYETVRRRLYES